MVPRRRQAGCWERAATSSFIVEISFGYYVVNRLLATKEIVMRGMNMLREWFQMDLEFVILRAVGFQVKLSSICCLCSIAHAYLLLFSIVRFDVPRTDSTV